MPLQDTPVDTLYRTFKLPDGRLCIDLSDVVAELPRKKRPSFFAQSLKHADKIVKRCKRWNKHMEKNKGKAGMGAAGRGYATVMLS